MNAKEKQTPPPLPLLQRRPQHRLLFFARRVENRRQQKNHTNHAGSATPLITAIVLVKAKIGKKGGIEANVMK